MPILKDKHFANYLLENQQKEMRAYDQKAGYYIASNSGLFVIALFTLCIFGMFHGETDNNKLTDIVQFGPQWCALLVLSIVYVLLFLFCNFCCFGVLFARVEKGSFGKSNVFNHSVTNPLAVDIKYFKSDLAQTEANIVEVMEEHIKLNISILKKKHKYANFIPFLSMVMGFIFLALTILLFVF